jgi:hypothetical protein
MANFTGASELQYQRDKRQGLCESAIAVGEFSLAAVTAAAGRASADHPSAVFEKIEPAFDQLHLVIDRCERLAFALVTVGASLSFEHKSEGEEHTEDLSRAENRKKGTGCLHQIRSHGTATTVEASMTVDN